MALLTALILTFLVDALFQHVVVVTAYTLDVANVDVVIRGNEGALHWYFVQVPEPEALEHDAREDYLAAFVSGAHTAVAHAEEDPLEEWVAIAKCRATVAPF